MNTNVFYSNRAYLAKLIVYVCCFIICIQHDEKYLKMEKLEFYKTE